MSKGVTTCLNLTGTGAAYLRVSTDKQDTNRQFESIHSFEERFGVIVGERFWFEDAGWERDADRERPEFNRLLDLARSGKVQWIVVDRLDRFGAKTAKRLFRYLGELEDAGCRLFDASGKEWTGEDDATEITAWLAGKTSNKEQREKSYRTLGGMIEKAKAGEWMGGPPKLGFDVACLDRATGRELWRVVWEGREDSGTTTKRRGKERPVYTVRRLKLYPDGNSERFDGEVVFRVSKNEQVMRIVPTRDGAKLEAVRQVFQRFATEAVTFFDLAKWLNGIGIRNSFGKLFQSRDVAKMLGDEAYLGYATFSKRRNGRFHRVSAGAVAPLEPELNGKDTENAPTDVIRSSTRLFDPLIDRPTWDAVQRKQRGRAKARPAPRCGDLYLAGLVVCAGCGAPMVARADRREYYCGTWDKHRVRGALADSPCERNGVKQSVLEEHVGRYLTETGRRLELLTGGADVGRLTARLDAQEAAAWGEFRDGIARLTGYLARHHPAEYDAVLREFAVPPEDGGPGPDDFVDMVVKCYRANFDPTGPAAEIERLEAEHTPLMGQWADLPTPRAKEKARERFATLEARIEDLRREQEDAAEAVAARYAEVHDLQLAVADARVAMRSEAGAQALRRRAEALRGLLCRIDCEFASTGKASCGPGNARSRLIAVTFLPVAGDVTRYAANGGDRSYGNP